MSLQLSVLPSISTTLAQRDKVAPLAYPTLLVTC